MEEREELQGGGGEGDGRVGKRDSGWIGQVEEGNRAERV